jgi:deaminated glutathione amidase
MRIAALQMVSTPDVARNLVAARGLIAQAARQGAELVALPEYFCLMGRADSDKLDVAEALIGSGRQDGVDGVDGGPIQQALAAAAREHRLWVIGGTLPLRCDDPQRVRNSSLVFAPDGTLAARYDKMHLFRFEAGRERYDEGRVLEAGATPVAVQCGALRVGLSVCYDLRFPELYRALMGAPRPAEAGRPPRGSRKVAEPHFLESPPCDLLAVPSAFTHTTGSAHWELLLRARAVENQAYVIAPAQGGMHENGRRTWGHTMIVDPWGDVLGVLPEGEGVVIAEVDRTRLAAVRAKLPALEHRRLGK